MDLYLGYAEKENNFMLKFKFINNLWFVNFVPIIVILLLLPLWLLQYKFKVIDTGTGITSLSIIIEVVVVPMYLLIVNFLHSKKNEKYNFVPNILLMLFVLLCNNAMNYLNWGLSTGLILRTDSETIMIINTIVILNIIIVVVGGIILQMLLLKKKKKL